MSRKISYLCALSIYLNFFQICSAENNKVIVRMGNDTILDGFTITKAAESAVEGDGVHFELANCTITDNQIGVRAINGNVSLKWCDIKQNREYAAYHEGEGFTLQVENTHIRKNQRWGIFCQDSTLVCTNSIVSEADLSQTGNAGITLFNASSRSFIQNATVAHNKSVGIWRLGGALPEIHNSIIYHNAGPALAGFSADEAAWYSCIEDANSVNYNINIDPQFAYFDPNNVRLSPASLCLNASNPYLNYSSQLDMDGNPRVYGAAPDMGAYELICDINVSNEWDLNADGVINLYEFNFFSRAWLAHDPNDPAWLADPELADPNLSEGWYEWKHKFNLDATGDSTYSVDLADLLMFLEDAPWLWVACWRTDLQSEMMMAGFGDEQLQMYSAMKVASEPPVVEQKSVQKQILDLAVTIVSLEQLWLEEPDIQQQIDPEKWQRFMEAVYGHLLELHNESVQTK
jgi:hypothetical protein